jgi:lipopolysaccharide transport system ATP-binding protein
MSFEPAEIAIRAVDLAKHYMIYARPEDRLKQTLVPRLQRLFGREPTTFYRSYAALNGVSFEVRKGETIGLIGRNGSGKSTLVELLQGSLTPTAGKVETHGRVLALQLGTGFNIEFTGRENIELNASVMGMAPTVLAERLDDIITFAGIGSFIDQPVKTYSSGMYSRLAFAVAAHLDADVLLVDEILAVGDMAFAQKCARFIADFKARGTLILCAHDMGAIKQHCDRVLWMDAGQLRMVGPPKIVCDEYQRMIAIEGDSSAELKFGGRRMVSGAAEATLEAPAGRDHRADAIAASTLRNEIKVFDFDEDAAWFGQRLATITGLAIINEGGTKLATLTGGEDVVLEVSALVHAVLSQPIIGFYVRNRQGQNIFGDNTYLTYRDAPQAAAADTTLIGRFRFQMPYLPTGDYSVVCAIANGTQTDHVQQHWIDDALVFHVASSHVAKGLCGIPMHGIELVTAGETAAPARIA